MDQPSQPVNVVVQQVPTNSLGLAGLVLSIIGWLTCGLLCIPGAFVSFLGLFSKAPKGLAIAGLIVGFPGVAFFLFVGLGLITAFLGIGAAATGAVGAAIEEADRIAAEVDANITQDQEILAEGVGENEGNEPAEAGAPIEITGTPDAGPVEPIAEEENTPEAEPATQPAEQPAEPEADPVPPEIAAKQKPRKFLDATGLHELEATVEGYKAGFVLLRRVDTGKTVSLELAKLSEADQKWLADNFEEGFVLDSP